MRLKHIIILFLILFIPSLALAIDQGYDGTGVDPITAAVGNITTVNATTLNVTTIDSATEVGIATHTTTSGNATVTGTVQAEHLKSTDDAEIAAFGLYSDNKETYIITVTAGDAGDYQYNEIYKDKVQHYLKKGELRTWNSITVPMLAGIPPEQSINLGFFDGTLERMFSNKSQPVNGLYTNTLDINTYRKMNVSSLSAGLSGESSWNSLVENLTYLLEEIKPDIIVAPYPALDSHPDHKFSSIALFEAIKISNKIDGHLYLYSNHF